MIDPAPRFDLRRVRGPERKQTLLTNSAQAQNDPNIQSSVHEELEWTPDVDAGGIGVAVNDGAVSLSGEVTTYLQRLSAIHAALRVRGARAVVDDIVVNSKSNYRQSETDLARSVQNALESGTNVPSTVKAELTGRAVTLTGEVQWDFERQSARHAVQGLAGIDSIDSEIVLRPRPADTQAGTRIKAALDRNASLAGTKIEVLVIGTSGPFAPGRNSGPLRRSLGLRPTSRTSTTRSW
ncbi:BON domain-containing protein [Subtercola boreus]|uniref:BON domain-containing protein n=1 Tax=Subtercola boreus TaxID=120213 RepID=UPI001C0EE373|nr:BON domain-containing protein [Subtercola boreus]